ncbi:unnamed protein product [Lactuca virosa]|uniref:Uncharacterized protein n=1 Tax=Lactuca virosa TaxID=75947 RepID=A0AAU9P2Q5_9ASTR|nr:unnamed protein product [Lactuca virosa]
MDAGIENDKQAVRKQLAIGDFNPEEPSATSQSTQAMHAAIKAFLDIDFASYLRFGELDLTGLCQLCLDPSAEEHPLMGPSGEDGPSSASSGN